MHQVNTENPAASMSINLTPIHAGQNLNMLDMRSIFISAKHPRVKHDLGICGLLNSGLLRDVEAVKELSDILVLHSGRLLDQSGGLGHSLDGVALNR